MHIIRSKKKFVSDVRQAVLSDIHKELSKSNTSLKMYMIKLIKDFKALENRVLELVSNIERDASTSEDVEDVSTSEEDEGSTSEDDGDASASEDEEETEKEEVPAPRQQWWWFTD